MFGQTFFATTSATPQKNTNASIGYFNSSKQQYRQNLQKQHRNRQIKRIKMLNSTQIVPYQKVKIYTFATMITQIDNPYSLLLTLFQISDQFSWRQYLPHLQILVQKITNTIQINNGEFLQELSLMKINQKQCQSQKNRHDFDFFQQKIEKMLYLSDKQFQEHVLIMVHSIIAYNSMYKIIDERKLSEHLLHRHSYQKSIRTQIFWILAVMTVNETAINKIIKIYESNEQKMSILLPILTIFSNFVVDSSSFNIEHLIANQTFQKIIGDGLVSATYAIQRQTVLLCNNILFKSQNCQNFMISQHQVIQMILKLQNQQSNNFRQFLQRLQFNSHK